MENHSFENSIREAFNGFEAPVNPGVWAGIQASLAAGTAATGMAASAVAWIAIGTITLLGAFGERQHWVASSAPKPAVNAVAPVSIPVDVASEAVKDEVDDFKSESPQLTAQSEVPKQQVAAVASTLTVAEQELKEQQSSANNEPAASANPVANAKVEAAANSESKPENPIAKPASPQVLATEAPSPASSSPKVCAVHMTHEAKSFISADGDGTNDCFAVAPTGAEAFQITIWTQAGERVFESTTSDFCWDGSDASGRPLPARTVCFYQINAVDADGNLYTGRNARGSVTVFR